MKTFKLISILGVCLITTVFFSNELFSNQKLKRQKRPFQALERLSDELELTEEQRSKIKDQRFATEKETIEMRAKIQIANLELKELVRLKVKLKKLASLKQICTGQKCKVAWR
ncbi:MAG: hypothetical protein ACE5HI_18090 [bacterium]